MPHMHGIRFVSDDQLPEGHDFVFVHTGGSAMIFYRASAITPQVLEDSWAAYRAAMEASPPRPPQQRRPGDLPAVGSVESPRHSVTAMGGALVRLRSA